MRRLLSILLLLSIALGPGAGMLPASALASALRSGWTGKIDESHLPACCRRGGKHHCSLSSDSLNETTASASEDCPWMPRTLASTAPATAALVSAPSGNIPLTIESRALHANPAAVQISDRRARPMRGPPATQIL